MAASDTENQGRGDVNSDVPEVVAGDALFAERVVDGEGNVHDGSGGDRSFGWG